MPTMEQIYEDRKAECDAEYHAELAEVYRAEATIRAQVRASAEIEAYREDEARATVVLVA